MSYEFKISFSPFSNTHLPFEDNEISLFKDINYEIFLKGNADKINESSRLAIIGYPFVNKDEAYKIGELTLNRAIYAFTKLRFPVDFGENKPSGGITTYYKKVIKELTDKNIINDYDGLMVYQRDEKNNKFINIGMAKATLQPSLEKASIVLKDVFSVKPKINHFNRIAYDIMSAAEKIEYPYSRFVTLMMALENLIYQEDRDQYDLDLIERLMQIVNDSSSTSKNSLKGSLQSLKKESISQAGKRLVKSLDKKYLELTPQNFFNECYKIRSDLVHGNEKKYEVSLIRLFGAHLHEMVGDLLELKMSP